MEPLKHIFGGELVNRVALHLERCVEGFKAGELIDFVMPRLHHLELKARARLIADRIHQLLPVDPVRRGAILLALLHPDEHDHADRPSDNQGLCGWAILPLTMIIGTHGLIDFDRSMALLREMTKRFSAEADVRPFILADQERALRLLSSWIRDPNRHVRRLVSEGTRPRLPWAMRLPALIRDPSPVLPLLEALRDDQEPYVRRSVANHLNDIAKDHPALVTELARQWLVDAPLPRQALLRHGCRTLIKKGDQAALALFGHGRPEIETGSLQLSATTVEMGDRLEIAMAIRSIARAAQQLSVDYVIHFRKANGLTSPKVFKGAILDLAPGETRIFRRMHRFREVTTRRHYPGMQAIALRINGEDTGKTAFLLSMRPETGQSLEPADP